MFVSWLPDAEQPKHRPVRFISSGARRIDLGECLMVLADFVERVIDRLHSASLHDTELEKHWVELKHAPEDEIAYCRAAARMGLNPYDIDDRTSELLVRAHEELPGRLFDDFAPAMSSATLEAGLRWYRTATSAIGGVRSNLGLGRLDQDPRRPELANGGPPWHVGYERARAVRSILGVGDDVPIRVGPEVDGELGVYTQVDESPTLYLEAVAGVSSHGSRALVIGREQRQETVRFTIARSIHDFVFLDERRGARHVLSAVSNRHQKTNRAFAAELLAPANGIRALIEGQPFVDAALTDEIARHFEISPWVVHYQIYNHDLAEVLVDVGAG